jgi:hypothetical protein
VLALVAHGPGEQERHWDDLQRLNFHDDPQLPVQRPPVPEPLPCPAWLGPEPEPELEPGPGPEPEPEPEPEPGPVPLPVNVPVPVPVYHVPVPVPVHESVPVKQHKPVTVPVTVPGPVLVQTSIASSLPSLAASPCCWPPVALAARPLQPEHLKNLERQN